MANSSKRRSSCRSRDGCDCHTYEYIGWHADHFIEPDEIAKITVVLHDVTAGVTLERKGKIYNLREPVIFIDSLHRCQNVHCCLHKKGQRGRIVQLIPDGGYRLERA